MDNIKWNEQGLVPAIAQDVDSRQVLMMAWMNKQALQKTLETGKAHFFSRSRQQLWLKGETSGNFLDVVSVYADCDGDTLLVKVRPQGPACHTGNTTCFFGAIKEDNNLSRGANVLTELFDVIKGRKQNPVEGSYTNYLFDKGVDKICKKVGEESAEVIIGAKNNSKEELCYEAGDLMYHLMVLLCNQGLTPEEVFKELAARHQPKESK